MTPATGIRQRPAWRSQAAMPVSESSVSTMLVATPKGPEKCGRSTAWRDNSQANNPGAVGVSCQTAFLQCEHDTQPSV